MERYPYFPIFVAIVFLVTIYILGPVLFDKLYKFWIAKVISRAARHWVDPPSEFQAVIVGNIPLLEERLASGIAIDSKDTYGRTLLYCATEARRLEVLDWLLRAGANTSLTITIGGEELTALGLAASSKWKEGAKLLLQYGAQMEPDAAILLGDRAFIRAYLDNGGNPNHLFSGKSLLGMAACHKDIELARLLLEAGADVNGYDRTILGWTPLHWAAQGQIELAELLILQGANIEKTDKCRLRALHVATSNGANDLVKLLLDNGADIEANSNAGTPLHAAAEKGKAKTISFLLDRGALCDRRNGLGETALHLAVAKGHFEAVQILLKWGANVHLKANFLVPVSQLTTDQTIKSLLENYETE